MSEETSVLGDAPRIELHHLLEEPSIDPAVIFAAYALAQARLAGWRIETLVIPQLAGRDRNHAQLVLESIRRGTILRESFLDDLEALLRVINPIIAAGTCEVPIYYDDQEGYWDSCRFEMRRTEEAETLDFAKGAMQALHEEVSLALDVIRAPQALEAARAAAARRCPTMVRRPIAFPHGD